ncbi:4Fe-4S binding protein [Halomonas sp. NO4]|uniref:4Fe-4S binding protein n=1 Tax=Halomonas sp. NO4 TaxID=2484813 RepID=UPI0013D3C33F|nr:4Fe-4S binding protein [Halomonas sp. NO4]
MNQHIQLVSDNEPSNRLARAHAFRRISWPVNLAPAGVDYLSRGHALLLGNERDVRRAAQALAGTRLASLTLLFTEPVKGASDAADAALLKATRHLASHALTAAQARTLRLDGHLGRFMVSVEQAGERLDLARALADRAHFDCVLDLGERPALVLELPPPGYIATRSDDPDHAAQLDAFGELIGEFDKPRYFQVNADLCAHSANGNGGCTRCLEVCPADAIASRQGRIDAWIEIDPFRCHGVGSCSSACPTGAIQFRVPETQRQQETLVAWLAAYREAGGTTPVVRFTPAQYLDEEHLSGDDEPAGHVLDVPLEELGAAGHDQWLAALAAGAAEMRLQYHPDMPPRLVDFLDGELALARALLVALGHDPERIQPLTVNDRKGRDAIPPHGVLTAEPLQFDSDDKRTRLDQVLGRLAALGAPSGERQALPAGAPYGGLAVDAQACTLCMACVASCPTPALAAGSDSPQLSFREADCVQCGLCAEACPEDAIRLVPGFLADATRRERRVCHEEAPFDCIRCGKPFATASTIATIKAKLADHPYFAGEAMARLEMCEDCRVRDVWRTLAHDPESQLKV